MGSGIELVKRIDEVLNDMSNSRRQFAIETELNPSTMATWKTKNIFPPVETIILLAQKLDVSIDWLVNGTSLTPEELKQREEIRMRIYDSAQIWNQENKWHFLEERSHSFEKYDSRHHEMSQIRQRISYSKLLNWSKGRCNIDSRSFDSIANTLNVSTEYLFTGEEKASNSNADLDSIAKINETALLKYNKLSAKNKQKVNDLMNDLYKLQQLEERDGE